MADALRAGDPERLGKYRVAGRLGEGGQGVVFLAEGPAGEQVAVKLLKTQFADDPTARTRFMRELALAERVAGFCTAPVIDADAEGDQPYIVSEYVAGPSLQELVLRDGPMRGDALQRLAIATATALAAIHEAGVVHRDFKPPNVLIGSDGPRVIDFGIARAIDAGTMTSHVVGTPAYMAPEQVAGAAIGPPADLFAWAVTVLYAATGVSPFGSDSIPAVMHRVLYSYPDLSALPQPLAGLVAACLHKDPAQRPAATQVLLTLLGKGPQSPPSPTLLTQGSHAAVAGPPPPMWQPVPTAPMRPMPTAPMQPERRGNPGLTFVAVALATLLVGFGVSMSGVVLPSIVRDLNLPVGDARWVTDAFKLAFAAGLVPAGWLADMIGRKLVFLIGLSGYVAASLVAGLAANSAMLFGGRAFQGLAAAWLVPAALGVLRGSFTGRRYPFALAGWGAALALGYTASPLITGELVSAVSWRVAFMIVVPGALIVLVLGAIGMPESRRRAPQNPLELVGAGLFTIALTTLALAGMNALAYGWGTPGAVLPLAAGLVCLAAVGALRVPLSGRAIGGGLLLAVGLSVVSFVLYFLNLEFQTIQGTSVLGTGLRLLPAAVTALGAAPLAGLLCARFGERPVLVAAPVVAGLAALSCTAGSGGSYLAALPGLLLVGAAFGAMLVAGGLVVSGEASSENSGVAGGVLQGAVALTGAGVAAFVAFAGHESKSHLSGLPSGIRSSVIYPSAGMPPQMYAMVRAAFVDGMHAALLVAGGVALVVGVLGLLVRRPRTPPGVHQLR